MLTPDILTRAVEPLPRGGVIALPTETVYRLAANCEDELAVRRVFAIKRRPATHPLIVHVARAAELPSWARHVPEEAWRLAEAFWPGPLTLVLPRTKVPEDPAGAARALYTRLREADEQGHDVLVACLPRAEGLGIAVRDRLARAAAPRSSGG